MDEQNRIQAAVASVVAGKAKVGNRGIVLGKWSDHEERLPGDEPRPAKKTAGAGMSLPPWCGGQGEGQGATSTPPLTNRGAGNSNETGGVDWCSVTFRAVHHEWKLLRGVLAAGKEDAQARSDEDAGVVELPGGTIARVSRTGTKGYVLCKWSIQVDGLLISFADKESPDNNTPNILVTISGRACLEKSFAWCSRRIDELLHSIGCEVLSESISRLDVCSDLPGIGVIQFVQSWLSGKVIRRSRKYSLHGDDDLNGAQTLMFGRRGELCCRMYDKLAEVDGDPEKTELMRVHRWGGKIPERATRVEFEVHKDVLRELGIVDRADMEEKLPALVKYLTEDWLRFAEKKVDRTNTTRAETSYFWKKTVSAFREWLGRCCIVDVQREKPRPAGKPNLEKQAMGCYAASLVSGLSGIATPQQAALLLLRKIAEGAEYMRDRMIAKGVERIFTVGDDSWGDTLRRQLDIWEKTNSEIRPMSPATWGY